MLRTADFHHSDHGERTSGEQAAEVTIALLGDIAELFLAATRVLLRHQSDPGREIATRSKDLRVRNAGDQRRRQSRANARQLVETPAHFIGTVPGIDPPVELQDLQAQPLKLVAERGQTFTGNLGHALVIGIGDHLEQFIHAAATHPRDNAELRQMRAGRVDDSRLLADE